MSDLESMADILKRLGITPRPIEDHTEYINATRAAVWHRACEMGRCRFAGTDIREENPPPVDSTVICGGYQGVRHEEPDPMHAGKDRVVWRWRICARHRAWQDRRNTWLRAEREKLRQKVKDDRAIARKHLDDE